MTKRKILFIVNGPSPYRMEFFSLLGAEADLTVVFERMKATDRNWKIEPEHYAKFKHYKFKGISTSPDSAFCPGIIKLIKRDAFDLIVLANYNSLTGILAAIWMKMKGIKYAIECDGGMRKTGVGLKEMIKRKLISSANWWFSTSNITDEYLLFYGAKRKEIFRYPFSSISNRQILSKPVSREEKLTLRQQLGIDEQHVVIAVGQFIYRKGFDVLLKACTLLDQSFGIYIIGGEATIEYQKLIADGNIENVHFLNFMTKPKLSEYYKAADIFVLPTREDNWGLVINEAMATGLPVITTDKCVAGMELISNDINGYIIPVEDHQAIAQKIRQISSNQPLGDIIAINNLTLIKQYTIENMVNTHLEIFEKIL